MSQLLRSSPNCGCSSDRIFLAVDVGLDLEFLDPIVAGCRVDLGVVLEHPSPRPSIVSAIIAQGSCAEVPQFSLVPKRIDRHTALVGVEPIIARCRGFQASAGIEVRPCCIRRLDGALRLMARKRDHSPDLGVKVDASLSLLAEPRVCHRSRSNGYTRLPRLCRRPRQHG